MHIPCDKSVIFADLYPYKLFIQKSNEHEGIFDWSGLCKLIRDKCVAKGLDSMVPYLGFKIKHIIINFIVS